MANLLHGAVGVSSLPPRGAPFFYKHREHVTRKLNIFFSSFLISRVIGIELTSMLSKVNRASHTT